MKTLSKVFVKNSVIEGRGMFAAAPLKTNELVHEMSGQEVGLLKCMFLVFTKQVHIDMPLQIEKRSYIILDELSVSANHSCEPNCAIHGKNQIIARRDIGAGEEITYDYSTTVIDAFYISNWNMKCQCGDKNCRKQIGNINSIGDAQLKKYLEKSEMPRYMQERLKKRRPDLFQK